MLGGVNAGSLLARALEERRLRATDRVFRLLGLVHSSSDIAAVSVALRTTEGRQRSGALELLDNMLGGEVRRRVMLLVEDMPAEERVRKGNVIYKTRPRDLEDTVAQLVHDDNQVVASAAILLIEERQLWSLADDLEHVLGHRDVRHWLVFEAASWALAASRMPEERRRQLWQEPLPAVVLVDRLRRLPLFDFTSVDELFRVVELGKQVRHETGRLIYERGASAGTLQFILDGRVVETGSEGEQVLDAPAPLAFHEILEGHPMRGSVRALEPTISLSITTEHFLSLLAENVELAEGIMRWIIDTQGDLQERVVQHGELSPEVQRKVAEGLQPVDRVLMLQASPLLGQATAAQLLRLAACARPLTLKAGHRSAGRHLRTVDADRAHGHRHGHDGKRPQRDRGFRRRDRHVSDAQRQAADGDAGGGDQRHRAPLQPAGHLRRAGRRNRADAGHLRRVAARLERRTSRAGRGLTNG